MRIAFIAVALILPFAASSQNFSPEELRKQVTFLASDNLKGRGTGTPEELEAAKYIAASFKSSGLKAPGGNYIKPFTFKKNPNPHDTSTVNIPERKGHNVVGFLDNGAKHTVVIGGHYDHLGLGHDRNSLDANPDGKIHNGADDNASGTVGVMTLAEYFATNKTKEPFNFLFICFSGEELGLIGSKKWCEQPDIDLASISYMINMDMIGRLNDSTHRLMIYGVGTSPAFVPLLDSIPSRFSINKDSSGVGPSDQTSFYLKDLPVLHFFTGQHADYHKPSDDADKVNYKGQAEVLEFIRTFIERSYPYGKMKFQRTRTPDTGKTSFKVTLGVMPDYAFDGTGMRIDGVTDGRPAALAGMQTGDIITKLGDTEINDIHAYMKALSHYKKGDSAPVEILRNDAKMTFQVTF